MASPRPAAAQPADAFFKGKTINFYIGFASGGSYDFYARMVARFIGKHIPGNPTVVPQAMLGAGSLQLANFLFSSAPRDGTAMGIVTQTVAIEDALHSPGVRYKAAEFTAIGRATAILEVAVAGPSAKAKSISEAKVIETPVAGTGAGSPSEGYPKLLNELAGTKFKVISGYTSSPQGLLAVERGEVDGSFTSWNTLKRTKQDWLRNHVISVLYQCALERHPDLPDTPTDIELGLTPEARQILDLLHQQRCGRSLDPGASRHSGRSRESAAHGVRRHRQGSGIPCRAREGAAGIPAGLGRRIAEADRVRPPAYPPTLSSRPRRSCAASDGIGHVPLSATRDMIDV